MNDLEMHIDQYLRGELSQDEANEFETVMQDDPSVKEEYELMLIASKAIKQFERKQLKAHFSSLDTKEVSINHHKLSAKIPFLKWAASISILIALGYGTYYLNQPSPDFFQNYFVPYPNYAEAITRGNNTLQVGRQKAFYAYEQGNFIEALSLFNEILDKEKEPEILFYKGVTLLATGNAQNAEAILKDLDRNSLRNYSESADWYLAMAYIAQKKWPSAKEQLESISLRNSYKRNEALELIELIPN